MLTLPTEFATLIMTFPLCSPSGCSIIAGAVDWRRWYRKEQATFLDTITLVRRCLCNNTGLSMRGKAPDMVEIPGELFDRLTDTLSYAA